MQSEAMSEKRKERGGGKKNRDLKRTQGTVAREREGTCR